MHKLLLAVPLFVSIISAKVTTIENITREYSNIHANDNSYKTKTIITEGISAEGTDAKYFYDKNRLKLIKVDILGEMGKEEQEYYFDNGRVFFIYIKEISYNAPMYVKEFNEKLSKTKTKRLYFLSGHLAKLLVNGKEVVKNSVSFKQEEKKSLHFVKMLLHTVKK